MRISFLLLAALVTHVTAVQAQPDTAPAVRQVRLPLNVSFVPGVSVGDAVRSSTGAEVVNGVSLNLLAGRAAHLDGVEFGGVWNAYTGRVRGAQFAGAVNTVRGDVRGAQFAGAVNAVGGDTRGAQFAGAVNLVGGAVGGAQFAGAANVGGDVRAVQFAGAVNVARGTVRGAQVAGAVNVARRVTGFQLGAVNVAGEHAGVPVGVVSYVRETGLRYDAWGDETGMATVALRTGNRRFSNYVGVAVRPAGPGAARWGYVLGFGAEAPLSRRTYGALEVVTYGLHGDSWSEVGNLSKLRLLGGLALTEHVAVFGGPTFSALVSSDDDGAELAPWSVFDAESGGTRVRLWPGLTFGARFSAKAL